MEKLIAVISLAFTLFSTGCQSQQAQEPKDTPAKQPRQAQEEQPTAVDKLYLNEEIKSPEILAWRDIYKSQRGAFTQSFGDTQVLLIGMGQQATGGYEVILVDTKVEAEQITVTYNTKTPDPDNMVTQAVTYPHLLLAVNSKKPFKVVEKINSDQVPVQTLQVPKNNVSLSKSFIVTAPTPQQAVKGSLHIEGYASVFEGAFQVSIEDGHNILAEKAVQTEGAPNWGKFSLDLPVDGATNPAGSVIFAYASAKDGSIINELIIPVKFAEIGEI